MSTVVAPQGRITRPGLPQKTTPCPKCKRQGCWAVEEPVGEPANLHCWNCGERVAYWEPGDPDWILVDRYRPAGAPAPAVLPPPPADPARRRPRAVAGAPAETRKEAA